MPDYKVLCHGLLSSSIMCIWCWYCCCCLLIFPWLLSLLRHCVYAGLLYELSAQERERELRAYGNIWIAYHPGQYMPCYCCFGCMDRSKSHVHIRRNIEQSTISCTCMVDQYAAQERWHYSRIMDVDILFLFFTSFIFIVVVSCSFRPVILSIFILSF